VYSSWGQRRETPEEIAARLRRFVDSLMEISPLFAKWRVGVEMPRFYESVRDNLVPVIQQDSSADEDRDCSVEGYWVSGHTREQPKNRRIHFYGNVGASIYVADHNGIRTKTPFDTVPDPTIIEYPVFKAILMATVDCWDPFTCGARSSDLSDYYEQMGPFHEAWMLYVPPHLAKTVQPPDIPVVESMSNGGLFLAAMTETFKTDNPVHLEAARRIGRATRHLNVGEGAKKWPPRQKIMYRDPVTGERRPLYP
jgi:hypothetical protein